jgi:hypothetical protein
MIDDVVLFLAALCGVIGVMLIVVAVRDGGDE